MRRILLVEDTESLAREIRELLEMEGYIVEMALNGGDALKKLARKRPDLIITDVVMPEMDGIEFLRRAQRDLDTIGPPAIVITAKDLESVLKTTSGLSIRRILPKPCRGTVLLETVAEILERDGKEKD